MNMLMLVVVALVALCYFGGNKCPKVLKDNKEMLLGVAAGLVLCSFFGMRLEGFDVPNFGDVTTVADFQACYAASAHPSRPEGVVDAKDCRDAYTMARNRHVIIPGSGRDSSITDPASGVPP